MLYGIRLRVPFLSMYRFNVVGGDYSFYTFPRYIELLARVDNYVLYSGRSYTDHILIAHGRLSYVRMVYSCMFSYNIYN